MFLPEGISFKKNAKILKAPKFKSPQKKTAKFRRSSCRHPFPPRDPWESGYHLPVAERNKLPRGSRGEVELWMFRFPCIYSEY